MNLKKYLHIFFYGFIAAIIIFPLLNHFILTLDMVFTPIFMQSKLSQLFYGFDSNNLINLPLSLTIKFVSLFIPTWLIQKMILFLILFLSGVSGYHLCPTESRVGKLFAGLIYMINPFVYIRFMAGHWLLLLAYSVTPFAIKSIMKFFDAAQTEEKPMKQTIKTCFWITLIGILNMHNLFLILFIFLVFFLYKAYKNRSTLIKTSKYTIILAVFFLILNLYWIIPTITANTLVNQIGESDLQAFTSRPVSGFNVVFSVAAMYGFWKELYILPSQIMPFWYVFFFIILFLAVHGYKNTKDKNKNIFLIVAVISLILATGISQSIFSKIFKFLFENVFLFRGFREPQKLVGLLVLAYSYFGGIGVADFAKELKKTKILPILIISLALITPFAYSITMFGGFWGQLKPVDYPQDWYEINDYLNEDKQDFNTLFLPWHMYMVFNWIPNDVKIIANPASSFFDKPVIQGDNMEIGDVYTQSTNPRSRYIEFLLNNSKNITNVGNKLALINVKYIILAKEADYDNYSFLFNQTDLELVKNTTNLLVFKNKEDVAKMYEVDSVSLIENWDKILTLDDVTNSAYIIADKEQLKTSEKHLINYTKKSPITYVVENPAKFLVFTEPYSYNWQLGNSKHYKNIVTNLYVAENEKVLRYDRFNICLVAYITSCIFFVILMFMLKRRV